MHWPEFDYHLFHIIPTGWFRPGLPGEDAVANLVIAADPTTYPALRSSFGVDLPDKLDGSETVVNKTINLGWKICASSSLRAARVCACRHLLR